MRQATLTLCSARGVWPLVAAVLAWLPGCATRGAPAPPQNALFSVHTLAAERSSPEYLEALERLEQMGPEADALLVALARDPSVKTTARANALSLLAERESPAALAALSTALLTEEIPRLRSAAVLGLDRLADTSRVAANLIKTAVGDGSRAVRLNALQALEISEVETIRRVLESDGDREVRQVARQLVSLAESRGAPLAQDRRGAFRTTGGDTDPAIVFRPARLDSIAGHATGDLRIELPQGPDIPLTPAAEVVAGVVPAFFSPDRSRVVFERDREIHVVDLSTREVVSVGPGIAPRLIPFTEDFVYLREIPDGRLEESGSTSIRYRVYRSGFGPAAAPEPIGEIVARLRPELAGHYSPVRWMAVGESRDGFVLVGEGIRPFLLPAPGVWSPGSPGAPDLPPEPHRPAPGTR